MLYANGFSVDEVRLAIQTFNSHLGRDASMEEIRGAPSFAALRAVLERHPMPKPAR
jgi:hypothetical protein